MQLEIILVLISAYLLGSINSAILVCKIFKLPSPRSLGSGNPGTTNVLRLGGKVPAICTLLGDALKGFIPVYVGSLLAGINNESVLGWVAFAAVLGHIFPIFFNFQGGKGVATLIGVMLGFSAGLGGDAWFIIIIFVGTWLLFCALTKYSSLSAIIATMLSPFTVYYFSDTKSEYAFVILAIIVIIRHKENIRKLVAGTESKIGEKSKKK